MSIKGWFHGRVVHSRRVQVLARWLSPALSAGQTVLDVGCGDGELALLIQQETNATVSGLDTLVRENAKIPVAAYNGEQLPYDDNSFDAVMFVDVLHHTDDPLQLLREAARVSRTSVLIKDHARDGLLAGPTLRFMDWVGNSHHGVSLPYNYWSMVQWERAFKELKLEVQSLTRQLKLYPLPADWLFGRTLHFVASLRVP